MAEDHAAALRITPKGIARVILSGYVGGEVADEMLRAFATAGLAVVTTSGASSEKEGMHERQ